MQRWLVSGFKVIEWLFVHYRITTVRVKAEPLRHPTNGHDIQSKGEDHYLMVEDP